MGGRLDCTGKSSPALADGGIVAVAVGMPGLAAELGSAAATGSAAAWGSKEPLRVAVTLETEPRIWRALIALMVGRVDVTACGERAQRAGNLVEVRGPRGRERAAGAKGAAACERVLGSGERTPSVDRDFVRHIVATGAATNDALA